MCGRFRLFLFGLTVAGAAGFVQPVAAQRCPDSHQAAKGFAGERGPRARTEVVRDGSIVRTIYSVDGRTLLETTQFEGVFELDRIDRGRRSSFKPKSDLAKLFPLKPAQRVTVEFELSQAGAPAKKATVAIAVTEADSLYIGPCKYKVLKIERRQSLGDAPLTFLDIDYYAPDLKLIIAKEFKEANGRTSLNKFDKIYPLND